MRLALAALVVCVGLGGCGGAEKALEPQPPLPKEWGEEEPTRASVGYRKTSERCRPARSRSLRICERSASTVDRCRPGELEDYDPCGELLTWSRVTIELRERQGWRVVARHPPGDLWKDTVIGHWRTAWLSTDGSTVLGQWSGECEVPVAFFVPVRSGPMRPVTGERDWTRSVASVAHGWSDDGRAHVSLLGPACAAGAPEPGRYLIDPATYDLEWVGPLAGRYAAFS